jgi:hypothetical protein
MFNSILWYYYFSVPAMLLLLSNLYNKLTTIVFCWLLQNMSMQFVLLAELQRHDIHAAIRVVVVRKWDFRGMTDNGPI